MITLGQEIFSECSATGGKFITGAKSVLVRLLSIRGSLPQQYVEGLVVCRGAGDGVCVLCVLCCCRREQGMCRSHSDVYIEH